MKQAIDTNVPIAANGRKTHASISCQYRCVQFLSDLTSGHIKTVVVLDELGLVLDEYRRYLYFRGQPGVGDVYFKYLHDNMHNDLVVRVVTITPNVDDTRGFDELPPNSIDKSDRKFLAIALVSGAKIMNALDTDWHEQHEFLLSLGVSVVNLCPEHACQEVKAQPRAPKAMALRRA